MKHRIGRASALGPIVVALLGVGCDSSPSPAGPSSTEETAVVLSAPALQGADAAPLVRPPAPTDTIFIDHGELDMVDEGGLVRGPMTLRANRRGFSMTADAGGLLDMTPLGYCNQIPACLPGAQVSLHLYRVGIDFPATFTLDGATYMAMGDANAEISAAVEFGGTITMPPFTARGADKVSAPFTFKGGIYSNIVGATFTGEGVATAWLTRTQFPDYAPTWRIDRLLYKFKHCAPRCPAP